MKYEELVKQLRENSKYAAAWLSTQLNEAADAIDELSEKIENAGQAMAETHRSWEDRCHAIISSLGMDFGGPTPDIPEEGSWYAINLRRAQDEAFEIREKMVASVQQAKEEAWAAAIEAALDAADKYMRDQYGIVALSHPIDRGRILDNLSPPSDAQAMLDRIKAEVRTGVMQQISDVRTWFHYPIVMPIKDGRGPVSDAECDTITWEVWDQLLNTHASFDNLPDAINEAMRLNNAMQDDAE